MKKLCLKLVAMVGLLASTFAFADTDGGYYSSTSSKAASLALPPTNITVLNYTEEKIYIAKPIAVTILSGHSDFIKHDTYYGNTRIAIQDVNQRTFFEQDVCRRAIITVTGVPGKYFYKVDGSLC